MTLWLEDLHPGDVHRTAARSLTETDLVTFSMLSGDWNPIHTDHDHAVTAGFPGRLLHGVLGLAVITGQMDRAGWFDTSAVAMLGIDGWRFLAPLTIGATVHTEMTIVSVRHSKRPGTGVVDRLFRLVDRRTGPVQEGHIPFLVASRPADPTDAHPTQEDANAARSH